MDDFKMDELKLIVEKPGGFDRENTSTVNVTVCATSTDSSSCHGSSLHKAIINTEASGVS
ncbi:unnamed protein product, partial [Darwinula stevensoni]